MPANILWKVDIVNRNREGDQWHTIKSHVRLIHVATGAALRFSGRQLPEWGFNQHEIVADRAIDAMVTNAILCKFISKVPPLIAMSNAECYFVGRCVER